MGWAIAAEGTHGLVSARTLRGWFRRLVTKTPTVAKASKRTSGRAPISVTNQALIVRLTRENTWGYRKIVGVMAGLGIVVSRSSVRRILQAHGIKLAPVRERARGSWRVFLAAHWSTLASIDLTCVPILTLAGWKTCYVGVVIQVATRRVHLGVVTCHPDQAVMQQIARSLTMADTSFLAQRGITHLIHDGGGEFCKTGFDDVWRAAGVEIVRIPPRAPNCNPHIERFFGSLKRECLHRFWFIGDRGLRHTVSVYCDFHNHRRPHQGIDNRFVDLDPRLANIGNEVKRSRSSGGILNFYHRAAA